MYQFLTSLAVLFVLWVAFPIGWKVSKSVPDEMPPARVYIELGIDVLFFLMLAFTLYGIGLRWSAALIILAALVARKFVEFVPYYVAASGAVLGLTVIAPTDTQVLVGVLCLVMNFLYGATTKKWKMLLRTTAWQPAAAVIVGAIATLL